MSCEPIFDYGYCAIMGVAEIVSAVMGEHDGRHGESQQTSEELETSVAYTHSSHCSIK